MIDKRSSFFGRVFNIVVCLNIVQEYEQLSSSVGKLSDNHLALMKRLKALLEEECQGIEKKKKFQEDYDAAVAWVKVKSNEHISW
jgi:hypothetical protein